jgi:NADH dehydrogenase
MAERESDFERRRALLTFVVIGGGPTGVELAGTIAELAHRTLVNEFRSFDPRTTRVMLIEAGRRVLPAFPEDLSLYARRALEKLGVEVRLDHPVSDCTAAGVIRGGEMIAASTVVWAAGVQASPAAQWIGIPADGAGRARVESDLTVPGHPEIFIIGDTAAIAAPDGRLVPGIAPAAKQQGRYVAAKIRARLQGRPANAPFCYRHSGSLATIGKRKAVIDFGRFRLRGPVAWWIWGLAHIYFLIGVRNRLSVALSWLWNYIRDQRSSRLITQGASGLYRRPGTLPETD